MRYVVQHRKASYIKFLVVMLSIFVQGFLTLFVVNKLLSGEFFPEDIKNLVAGNPDIFLEGIETGQIVEKVHIELFLLSVVFLTVFSINLRLNIKDSHKITLSIFSFLNIWVYVLSFFLIKLYPAVFSNIYTISLSLLLTVISAVNLMNIIFFTAGKIK
ncbi:hypothetical protein GWK41_09300 [Persephonella atlantica]|uniref:Uncharacterized protein n=1 Tax=Persephonella atlantica TaxID=2699429 RepID=A0ABS1GK22_9AQUI|nr:hypothetical protein [Persephonella atlantica]MBK3333265.1 hypothetical protein [Persephonella atlantica]